MFEKEGHIYKHRSQREELQRFEKKKNSENNFKKETKTKTKCKTKIRKEGKETKIEKFQNVAFFKKKKKVMFGKTSPDGHLTYHNLSPILISCHKFFTSYTKLDGLVVLFCGASFSTNFSIF